MTWLRLGGMKAASELEQKPYDGACLELFVDWRDDLWGRDFSLYFPPTEVTGGCGGSILDQSALG